MNYGTFDENEPIANRTLARNAARKIHRDFKPSFPVSIEDILAHFQFSVLEIDINQDEISALVDLDNKYIGVNKSHSDTRKRFTLAHELGHIYMNHKESRNTEFQKRKGKKEPYEIEADEFAAELLMPLSELKRVKDKEISEILKHFNVSKGALFVQMSKYKLI